MDGIFNLDHEDIGAIVEGIDAMYNLMYDLGSQFVNNIFLNKYEEVSEPEIILEGNLEQKQTLSSENNDDDDEFYELINSDIMFELFIIKMLGVL
jgi:hypothetical protein